MSAPREKDLAASLPSGIRCVAVLSGKGGVGKSLVTALLAAAFARSGRAAGILDADITGPSIPRMFGVRRVTAVEEGRMSPARTRELGIRIMSINLLMESEDDPVVWRGPLVSRAVEQFVTDVDWTGTEYLFIDLPPGTSDVPLTVMQRLPLSGLVVVSSPQELVGVIVRKAIKMAEMLQIPVIGLVENMSHLICPHCGKKIDLFGAADAGSGDDSGVPLLARIPLDPALAALCDKGDLESYEDNPFASLVESIARSLDSNGGKDA